MTPDRRPPHLRLTVAVLTAALLGVAAPSSAAGPPGTASPAGRAGRPGEVTTVDVTLVTGDRVRLTTSGDRRHATPLPDAGDRRADLVIEDDGERILAIPVAARQLLAEGRLDERLFDVTGLAAAGYTSGKRLPLIVAAPASPLVGPGTEKRGAAPKAPAAPAGSTARRALPSLGATAVDVTNPVRFWATVTSGSTGDATRAAAPGVGKIWLDGKVRATLDRSVPQIGGPAARAKGLDGAGVTVAVLDSGIDDQNADVDANVAAEADFSGAGNTDDEFGHGTHVASIIAGTGASSNGRYAGVAPEATLLDGRVLDAYGYGTDSGVLAGMEWAAPRARVVNMSIGSFQASDGSDPVSQAVDTLTARHGTLFVVSAGNSGPDPSTIESPGAATSALTVGAVDRDDSLAGFSSRGPRLNGSAVKPEITAPGVGIVAAQADGTELGEVVEPGYVALSGTSMAAPHVAGAAALLAQQKPALAGPALKARLVSTSKAIAGTSLWDGGAGRADLATAGGDPVRVDAGTLDAGSYDWPHGGDAPVVSTLTYTNDASAPVDVRLTAAMGDGEGTAAPAAALTLDATAFTLAAGASRAVRVTASPDELGVGRWSGAVTATTAGGTTRTVLGALKESEHYTMSFAALTRAGDPATPFVSVVDLATGDVYRSFDGESLRLPASTYRVGGWIVGDDDSATLVTAEHRLTKDATVPLDARGSVPYSATAPAADAEAQLAVMAYRVRTPGGQTLGSSYTAYNPPHGTTPLWARPGGAARTGTFTFGTATAARKPPLTARIVDGARLDPILYAPEERLAGTRTVDVVRATSPVAGAYLLATPEEGDWDVDTIVDRAAAAGAAGVILSTDDTPNLFQPTKVPAVPTFILRGDQWRALGDAAGTGRARLTLTGNAYPQETWNLTDKVTPKVPASLTYRYRRPDLAAVERTFRGHGHGGTGVSSAYPAGPASANDFAEFRHGTRRTEWMTPGTYEIDVRGFESDPMSDAPRQTLLTSPRTYRAGHASEVYFDQLTAAGIPAVGRFYRSGDEFVADIATWTDPQGTGDNGFHYNGQHATWKLSSGGREIASHDDGWPIVRATLPPGKATYDLDFVVTREVADGLALSTRVAGRWTFTSETTAPDSFTDVPALSVDVPLPLDIQNSAPRGRAITFPVSGRVLADPTRLRTLTVESSADGGRTWQPAKVTRAGGRFDVRVVNPDRPGTVDLRLTATAAGGLAISEEVTAAYAVR